jgi:hypothetical protein
MNRKKRQQAIIFILIIVYVSSYLLFRNSSIEIWQKDGGEWVNLKANQAWIYYLYWPLIYIDTSFTSLSFYIEPGD